jgi:hypothetical protein
MEDTTMSAATRLRIRRWLIVLASAAGLLGWTVAAAAADPTATSAGPTTQPASRPDGAMAAPKWASAAELLDAAQQVNTMLVAHEGNRSVVPWDKADLIRRMLLANRGMVDQLHPNGQGCFQQALYLSSIAAGYPDDAMAAARATVRLADELKLPKMQMMAAWVAVSWAAMLQGNRAACLEVVDQMQKLAGTTEGFDAMKREVEPIGTMPTCEMKLSDHTTINPAKCPGKVLMVDFWMYINPATQDAAPMVRKVRELFNGYTDFRIIGVNMDSHDGQPAASKFAQVHGFDWPSYYEGRTDPAISNKVFMVHVLPTEIVVGPDGKILYAGKPNNPTLVYAIRAALVKANKGEIPKPDPAAKPLAALPVQSSPAEKPPAEPATSKIPPTSPPADSPGAADAKPTAEQEKAAAQQLKVALAFVAADAKPQAITTLKQIIAKWPNTKAAFDAKAKLLELEY